MAGGLAIDDTATRLANAQHMLREMVHLSCGWIERAPRLEVKLALARHASEDAEAITQIRERLGTLRPGVAYPGAPGDRVAELLATANGCASAADYIEATYGVLKPALIATVKAHLKLVDPLLDEPTLRLLTQLLHTQERHVGELPTRDAHPQAHEDVGADPVELGWERRLNVMEPLDAPARDGYLDPLSDHDGPCARVHELMAAELRAAETAALDSHAQPRLAWEFHAAMAAHAAQAIRHVSACDRLLGEELDCRWGNHELTAASTSELLVPTGHASIDALVEHLSDAVAVRARESERWAGQVNTPT